MPSGLASARNREDGFTLLEFVVAITLLMIVLIPAADLMSTAIAVSGNTRSRIAATYLASSTIETVRGSADNSSTFWNPPPLGNSTTTSAVNNVTFSITKEIQWVAQGQPGSNCSAGGSNPEILQVTASVIWPRMLGGQPVQTTTDIAPPVGAFSAISGGIGSQVTNAAGNPVSNVDVTISGPTSAGIVTGADGCAFFAFLAPGSYTVSAVLAGDVSNQELAAPSYAAVVVAVSQTVSAPFVLDQSTTISATVTASPAGASGLPLSVANTSLSPYGFVSFPAGTTSLTPLFPYANGYVPFAGSCSDSDPLGNNTTSKAPFYPTGSGATVPASALIPVDATSGATAAASVQLYPLTLKVQATILGVVSLPIGAAMTAIPTVAGNAKLSPSWSASINWVCPAPSATYGLAVTLVGGLSTTGVGLGHYTVVQTSKPTTPLAFVWVEPDGTHLINTATGAVTAAPSTVTVPVTVLP